MSGTLIWIVTVLYTGQAAASAWQGQWPMVIVMVGYAFANVGLIWGLGR